MERSPPHDSDYEDSEGPHRNLAFEMLRPYSGKWDGLCALLPPQQVAWNAMIETEDFENAQTRREQIGIAMQTLNRRGNGQAFFSHETLAAMFNIKRSTLEEQYMNNETSNNR